MINVKSYLANPILSPNTKNKWEDAAAFNGCIVKVGQKYHLLYRALSEKVDVNGHMIHLSTIGIATGSDKHHFTKRKQLLTPEYEWERYGLEDPRITKFDDTYYIFYTAISSPSPSADSIKVAVAITKDFVTFEKHLVTPFNAKAMALFPELVDGKMTVIFSANTDRPPARIVLAQFDKPQDLWSTEYWRKWYAKLEEHEIQLQRITTDQTEVGAPPIKTKDGWLMVYSHIQNYYSGNNVIFGIEAAILDSKEPQTIVGQTREPLLVPQEDYEMEGMVPNIIFPSGALIENNKLFIYYGAADTRCAMAMCDVTELCELIISKGPYPRLKRADHNPIITCNPQNKWESQATFNPTALAIDDKIYIIYRAMGDDNTSVFGLAVSHDGVTISERIKTPIYVPTQPFELKSKLGCFSGCEDPRITQIGEKLYLCYTAYDGSNPPRIAFTSIAVTDFVNRRWNWQKPKLISRPNEDNKDACLFPDKVNGKYVFCHRQGGKGIVLSYLNDLEFENDNYLSSDICIGSGAGNWDDSKIGVGPVPIKTEAGWLMIYHGVDNKGHYRSGTMLLESNNPSIVKAINRYPILEPELSFEKIGVVNSVVFPCGTVVRDGEILVYYGGADKVVAVARGELNRLVEELVG